MEKKTGVGIAIALAAVTGLVVALTRKAGAAEPGEEKAKFYMPSTLKVSAAGPVDGEYIVTFSTTITNKGNATGSHQLEWGSNEVSPEYYPEASRIITLEPGESYEWSWSWPEIPDYYLGYFTCWLFGDWETNNEAKGVWK